MKFLKIQVKHPNGNYSQLINISHIINVCDAGEDVVICMVDESSFRVNRTLDSFMDSLNSCLMDDSSSVFNLL